MRLKYLEGAFRVVQCRGCGLVYLANPPPPESLYREYYAPIRTQDPVLTRINARRVALLRRIRPAGRLLDVGCGTGAFLSAAKEAGYDVMGIDIAERALGICRERGLTVRSGTLAGETGRAALYDIVTLWHVLEHFLDPYQELRRVNRLLQPGGLCLIEVPNLAGLKFRLSRVKWRGGDHPRYHRTFFTRRTLGVALFETGFVRTRFLHPGYGNGVPARALKTALSRLAMDSFLTCAASAGLRPQQDSRC